MIGHIKISNIKNQKSKIEEEQPTSLSRYWITEVLRNQLDFNGVIITDDLTMKALSQVDYSQKNINKSQNFWWVAPAAIESIKAGADMVMIVGAPEVQKKVYQKIIEAIKTSEISEKSLDESLLRALKLKYFLNSH